MSSTLRYGPLTLLLLSFGACATSAPPTEQGFREPRADLPSVPPPLGSPLVVQSDLRVSPGEYLRPALGPGGERGVVVLEGLRDVTLDMRGVTLRGVARGSAPDAGHGQGLVLRNCENVEVVGGEFSGYLVGVRVEGCNGVRLDGVRVAPAFGSRLVGTDALPHPHDQLLVETKQASHWLERYGAAIAVIDSSGVEVRRCSARGGQNGLVAMRSEACRFLDNDFSFLSGWGIALSHCDSNLVAGNRCDAVTRRGTGRRAEPDHGATGILLAGGSSDNTISGNSARRSTAGGRELFAEGQFGQRNRWFANDFSGAACVALDIEGARGSWYVGNRIRDGHGFGLHVRRSEQLAIVGNEIEGILGEGIVLEGGHHAVVSGNRLADCDSALAVYPGELESGEERDFYLGGNRFENNIQDLVLEQATGLELVGNDFQEDAPAAHLDGLTLEGQPDLMASEVWQLLADSHGDLPSGRSVRTSLHTPTGQTPRVLHDIAGWSPEAPYAELPDAPASRTPRGREATVMGDYGPWDPRGDLPRPRSDRAGGLLAGARWQATWFRWDTDSDPRGSLESWRARRFEPERRAEVSFWSDPWGGDLDLRRSLPDTHFGLLARTEFHVPQKGTYVLRVVSDDGVRIAVDDEDVLEDWTWHHARQRSRSIELDAGSHSLILEYFQIDGAAVLTLELSEPPGS